MRAVYFKKWTYDLPDNWNELTGKQLLQVIKVTYQEKGDVRGLLMLFRALVQIPWYQFFMMRNPNLMPAAEDATQFLFEENTLTKNLIPFYKGYAGPADQISNLKMGEFLFSEFYFRQFRETKNENYLDKLVATLYRPRKSRWTYNYKLNKAGDYRIAFNPNTTDYHEKKVKKWPTHVKYAILQFYEGARNQKIAQNPKVFDSSEGEESLYGLWSVMRSVAKGGHFGDIDKVQEQYIDTVLMELNETVAEAEKIEMERNKVKSER